MMARPEPKRTMRGREEGCAFVALFVFIIRAASSRADVCLHSVQANRMHPGQSFDSVCVIMHIALVSVSSRLVQLVGSFSARLKRAFAPGSFCTQVRTLQLLH